MLGSRVAVMVYNWKDPISSVAGCNLKLLVPSLSAFTRDQLTLHFPSGSGIPAATPRRYEPHGMTEIFIKNLPTSVGGRGDVGGCTACIWLQQLLVCGWMKMNVPLAARLFWRLEHSSTSWYHPLFAVRERWASWQNRRIFRATAQRGWHEYPSKIWNPEINDENPFALSSPQYFPLLSCSHAGFPSATGLVLASTNVVSPVNVRWRPRAVHTWGISTLGRHQREELHRW